MRLDRVAQLNEKLDRHRRQAKATKARKRHSKIRPSKAKMYKDVKACLAYFGSSSSE